MSQRDKQNFNKLGRKGFTLIELVTIIVILGILATVAVPRFVDLTESSKISATKQEMTMLKKAISGNPDAVAGGQFIDRGFEGDVGFIPSALADLAAKPGSLLVYNKITRLGWNGPYIDSTKSEYLTDAWGSSYILDRVNRCIISTGGPDSIQVHF